MYSLFDDDDDDDKFSTEKNKWNIDELFDHYH